MEFSRQEYWSRLPFPTPGDLPDPRIKPASLESRALVGDSLPLNHLGSPWRRGDRGQKVQTSSYKTNKSWGCKLHNAFKLWCWRWLLRVSWTARRLNPSSLKEINPEYSLERLMLKLKPQYFGNLMWRANSSEKTLMLRKMEGKRRRGQQRMRRLDIINNSMNMNLSKLWEIVENRGVWYAAVHGVTKSWIQLSDWTTNCTFECFWE